MADEQRPLGDTPEAHDEITPHDLPADHPGRAEAERQAARGGGVTRGDVDEDVPAGEPHRGRDQR